MRLNDFLKSWQKRCFSLLGSPEVPSRAGMGLGCPSAGVPTRESVLGAAFPAGMGAASSLSQAQLHLSGLPTTATGKISPLPLVTCLHFAIIGILAQFGFFLLSKLELLLCQERGQQAVFSLSGKFSHYSSNISLCKRGFSASLKTARIFSFFLQ